MKFVRTSVLVCLALLLATNAFAAKGSLQISDPVTVNGKPLPAGDYTLQWDGNGPDVQLNIHQGKKVVATVPAHVVMLNQASGSDSAVVVKNNDGSRTLSEIRFGGKKYSLAIGESAFFIPIEVFELVHRPSWMVASILALNIFMVWYLFANRERLFRHHH